MSDALPVVDAHVAAGEGWALSRGHDARSGEVRLLITVAEPDPAGLRRRLAVAGSVAGRHLAEVVDAVAVAGGVVKVVVVAPSGPSLAQLGCDGSRLRAGEVVTLVAPLASALAALHRRGLCLDAVGPATVWLAADGCPLLVPVGCRDLPADAAVPGDVMALAAAAAVVLDPASPGGAAVAAALEAAADGRLDVVGLAAALARATPALPITMGPAPGASPGPRAPRGEERRGPATRGRARPRARAQHRAHAGRRTLAGVRRGGPALATVAVIGLAIGIGALSGRAGGSAAVLAAPSPAPAIATATSTASTAATPSPPPWREVVAGLERLRAEAFSTGKPELLGAVYAVGSPTGAADRRLLRGLVRRGQRAAGLEAYVESADLVTATDTRVTLQVTDALAAYDVVTSAGQVVRRGHGRPTATWQVSLVRTTAGWRIWSVTAR